MDFPVRRPAPKPSAAVGDLVAIRLHHPQQPVVGRVVDAYQSVFLLHRNNRGTTGFEQSDHEVWAGHIGEIVAADPDKPLSQALEALWLIADGWASPGKRPARRPGPLTHRIEAPPQET